MFRSTDLWQNRVELQQNLGPEITVCSSFNTNLSGFALRNRMSTNYEKCVPGNKKNFYIGRILNIYREI
jgi:hypothetical protein